MSEPKVKVAKVGVDGSGVVDFFEYSKSRMTPERIAKAEAHAAEKVRKIRLDMLREKLGVRQKDNAKFPQSSVSRMEKKSDIRISTLIKYVESLDCGLEIKAYPHDKKKGTQAITLLKF